MVTGDRLYLGKSEIEYASNALLQSEIMRLRGELQKLADDKHQADDVQFLLTESEVR